MPEDNVFQNSVLSNEKLVALITSEARPLSGQKARSSQNFSTAFIPESTTKLRFEVESLTGVDYADNISFDVVKDVPNGGDQLIYKDVHNNNVYNAVRSERLYIANPKGATGPFDVYIYARY